MSKFTGPLRLEFNKDVATLLEPLYWDCDELYSGLRVMVPSGFVSDGATVPRLFWWFMPPFGDRGTRAALLHDYLLEMIDSGTPVAEQITRGHADWQLFLALRALKVSTWRASVIYLGVRTWSMVYEAWQRLPFHAK
jgi:hypothetical protein